MRLTTPIALLLCFSIFHSTTIAQIEKHASHPSVAIPPSGELTRIQQQGSFGYQNSTQEVVIPCSYDDADYFYDNMAAVKQGIHYGYINTTNKVVIPMQYDFAWSFSGPLAVVKQDGKFGLIDKQGRLQTNFDYDYIGLTSRSRYNSMFQKSIDRPYFSEQLIRAEKKGTCGFLDTLGKVAIPFKFDHVWNFSGGLAAVVKKGKAGFINTKGNIQIPLVYDYTWSFEAGIAIVESGGKLGAINTAGTLVIPTQYDNIQLTSEGQAIVYKTGTVGVIDTTGRVIIGFNRFHTIRSIKDTLYLVKSFDEKKGIIDRQGKEIIAPIYDNAYPYISKQLILLSKNKIFGLFDCDGNTVLPIKYDPFYLHLDQALYLITERQNEKMGLIDNKGNIFLPIKTRNYRKLRYNWVLVDIDNDLYLINLKTKSKKIVPPHSGNMYALTPNHILVTKSGGDMQIYDTNTEKFLPNIYDEIQNWSDQYFWVKKGKKEGLIDTLGKIAIPLKYDRISRSGDKIHAVKHDTVGYIDHKGEFTTTPVRAYSFLGTFSTGYSFFEQDNKDGILFNNIDTILPPNYHIAFHYQTNLYPIYNDQNKQSWVDKKGHIIAPFEYDYIAPFESHVAVVHQSNKKGLINTRGEIILPPVYDAIQPLCMGILAVSKKGKVGLVDDSGKRITPLNYDRILGCKLDAIEALKNDKVGLLDYRGNVVVPFEYDIIDDNSPTIHYAVVVNNKGNHFKYGIINKNTKKVSPVIYDEIRSIGYNMRLVGVRQGNYWGVINLHGEVIVPCLYHEVKYSKGNWIEVIKKDSLASNNSTLKVGVYDFSGKNILPCQYDGIKYYKENLFFVYHYNTPNITKGGIVDQDNKAIVPIAYDRIYPLYNQLLVVEKDGKKGVMDKHLKWIMPIEYDEIHPFDNYLVVKKENKMGWVDLYGNTTIPLIYDRIDEKIEFGHIAIHQNGKQGWIDTNNTIIIPVIYDAITYYGDGIYKVKKENKFGFMDSLGKLLMPCQYDRAYYTTLGTRKIFGLVKDAEEYLLDSETLKLFLPQKYQQIRFMGYPEPKIIVAQDGEKQLLFDLNGNLLEHPPFEQIRQWHEYLMITQNNKKGLLDYDGQPILTANYEEITNIRNRFFRVKKNGKIGIVTKGDNIIYPLVYDAINCYKDGIRLYCNEKEGRGNEDGKIHLKCVYDEIKNTPQGITYARIGSQYGVYTPNTATVACIYDQIQAYSSNKVLVKKDNLWGMLDIGQGIIIPIAYDTIYQNILVKDGKYGMITNWGSIVVPPVHHTLSSAACAALQVKDYKQEALGRHIASLSCTAYDTIISQTKYWHIAQKDDKYGMIDNNDNILLPFEYDYIKMIAPHVFLVKIGAHQGLVDRQNNVLIPIEYEYINYQPTPQLNNPISAQKNGLWGYLNLQGDVVIPFIYKEVGVFYRGEALVMDSNNNKFYINTAGKKTMKVYTPKYRDDYIWDE